MKNTKDETLLPLLFPSENKSIKHYAQVIPVAIHHFYINNEINDIDPYLDMINTLKTAEEHDTVFIYLNTPGGNLDTTVQIISAIKQSQASVITALEGSVASAGTLIFLSGDKFMVNPNCTFMIHNYSQWTGGKGNEVVLHVEYQMSWFKKLANDIYKNFLSPAEITLMLEGKDFWMESEQVAARLKKFSTENEPALIDISDTDTEEKSASVKTASKKVTKKKVKKKAKKKKV